MRGIDTSWLACGIYDWANRKNKHKILELIRKLKDDSRSPVVIFGDFNEILCHNEKDGGSSRADRDMDAFREFLNDCGLQDIGYRGSTFTWSRGNSPTTMVIERLDKFVACSGWLNVFHSFDVRHFPIYRLDHAPIMLSTSRP